MSGRSTLKRSGLASDVPAFKGGLPVPTQCSHAVVIWGSLAARDLRRPSFLRSPTRPFSSTVPILDPPDCRQKTIFQACNSQSITLATSTSRPYVLNAQDAVSDSFTWNICWVLSHLLMRLAFLRILGTRYLARQLLLGHRISSLEAKRSSRMVRSFGVT